MHAQSSQLLGLMSPSPVDPEDVCLYIDSEDSEESENNSLESFTNEVFMHVRIMIILSNNFIQYMQCLILNSGHKHQVYYLY